MYPTAFYGFSSYNCKQLIKVMFGHHVAITGQLARFDLLVFV